MLTPRETLVFARTAPALLALLVALACPVAAGAQETSGVIGQAPAQAMPTSPAPVAASSIATPPVPQDAGVSPPPGEPTPFCETDAHTAGDRSACLTVGCVYSAGHCCGRLRMWSNVRASCIERSGAVPGLAPAVPDDPSLSENSRGARISYEALAALATVGVGAALGAILGAAVQNDHCDDWLCISRGFDAIRGTFGGMLATVGMAPFFVALTGNAHGGRGNLGAAYLGLLVGGAAGVCLGALGFELHDFGWGVTLVTLGSVLAVAGPIISYELSDQHERSRPRVVPSVGLSAGGANLGATVAF
jgi:hypothetical protein